MHNIVRTALLLTAFSFGIVTAAQAASPAVEQANKILSEVKKSEAPDGRQVVFDLRAWNNKKGQLVVGGTTSEQSVRNAVAAALDKAGIQFADSINVYPSDKWAQVRIPAASLRTGGRHAAEMATQAVLGTPLRVLETGEWWRVQTPDGYIAYVPSTSVVAKTPAEMDAWRKAKRFIVTDPYQIRVYTNPTTKGLREVVTDLVNGCIVAAVEAEPVVTEGRYYVELPDGRRGYVDAISVTPIEEWAAQDFNPDQILDIAYSMEGTPYLWGGTSTKALDCSGLAKVSYFSNGIILMRDASQQALTGTRIEAEDWRTCQPGDLLFFGNAQTGKVTHVAIYDHDGNYVHSSGRVKRNSVDPSSPSYLTTPFLHAVRIAGNEGTRGITQARNHPWYF